jgi:hypothetical protein
MSVCSTHPPPTDCDRKVIDRSDTKLLETLHPADDVEDGVKGSNLMKVNLFRSHTMYPALGLPQQTDRFHGALTNPVGEGGALDDVDQLRHVPAVGVALVGRMRGSIIPGDHEIDFGRLHGAPLNPGDAHADFR